MKVQKIVSLTPETMEIAQKMDNFSGWVRRMLWIKENDIDTVKTVQRYQALVRTIADLEDKELQQSIMNSYSENLNQKKLEDFE
tara:strand:+ start:1274 stop:1525 length:252 start_codon:yes stop_codon:yes gene_type:complete